MKYSKMQLHGNVCVHQMSVIFILKIKDYFSSNKADVTTYICLFIYNMLYNEIHKMLGSIYVFKLITGNKMADLISDRYQSTCWFIKYL